MVILGAATAEGQDVITTVAGTSPPNGVPAATAAIIAPAGVAVDRGGNVYFASRSQYVVYKVDPSNTLTIVAGVGFSQYPGVGDDGPATAATLLGPQGITLDASGNLFIADGQAVRRVDARTQVITIVAGIDGTSCGIQTGGCGDGGPATSAALNGASAVAVDASGNLFITDGERVRRVDASSHVISTFVGNGVQCPYAQPSPPCGDGGVATSAELNAPSDVVVDSGGNLFIADLADNRIRRVDAATHTITTVAGTGGYGFSGDNGPATSAELSGPSAIALDASGNLFILDSGNLRIRWVDATTHVITTVAGNGTRGFSGDGGPAGAATFNLETGYPAWPGLALDAAGDILIADYGNNRIRRVAASTQIINTIAGNNVLGDGGAATSANLVPAGVAVDALGNIFIADGGGNRVRRVDADTGIITTYAGSGIQGRSGDGGLATNAEISVSALAIDSAGNLFIAESIDVRKVTAATGIITTVAGPGNFQGSGDGGPAKSASFCPSGITLDSADNLYIADYCHGGTVRRVDASTQIITTVAGNGTPCPSGTSTCGDGGLATNANLGGYFQGLAVDSSGSLFIADSVDYRIRRVDAGSKIITTVAGSGSYGFSGNGGPGTQAQFCWPAGLAVDTSGNVFISDLCAAWRWNAQTGTIIIVAGTGVSGTRADGGPATSANVPAGSIALDDSGNLYVTEGETNRVRKVTDPVAPAAFLSSASLTFLFQAIGTSSASQSVTLTNTGDAALSISSVAATAGFAQTNNCGASVAIGAQCTLNITFSPTVAGAQSGTITITDSAALSPQVINVSGTGTGPAVAFAPTSLPFDAQLVNSTSAAQTVTVTNMGDANLTFTAIGTTGPFAIATSGTTCSTSSPLAASGSCTVAVTFTPTSVGTASGSLSFTDNAGNSPQTVGLTGTGTGAVVGLSAPPTFPSEPVGTTSPAQTVAVTNTGNANLTFTTIGVTGPFAIAASGTTCSTSSPVAASGSCTVALTFTPTAEGAASGTLSLTDNASGSPQTVSLTATGQDFSLAVATGSSSSATVSPGGTATYTITATAIGGFNQSVTLSCSGAPSEASCQLSQASVTPSSSGTPVTVTVTTTAPSVTAPRPRPLAPTRPFTPWPGTLAMLALLLAGVAWAVRNWGQPGASRVRTAFVALALGMLLALVMAACGGGAPSAPGTPPGTYTITVTGSSGSGSSALSHSVKLTLTVS
jgi:hypothetical protein